MCPNGITLTLKIDASADPTLVRVLTELISSLAASGKHPNLEVITDPGYDETDFVRLRDLKKFLKKTGLTGFGDKAKRVWYFFSKYDFQYNPNLLIVCANCEKVSRQCRCGYRVDLWKIGKQSLLQITEEDLEGMSPESRSRLLMFAEHLRGNGEQQRLADAVYAEHGVQL